MLLYCCIYSVVRIRILIYSLAEGIFLMLALYCPFTASYHSLKEEALRLFSSQLRSHSLYFTFNPTRMRERESWEIENILFFVAFATEYSCQTEEWEREREKASMRKWCRVYVVLITKWTKRGREKFLWNARLNCMVEWENCNEIRESKKGEREGGRQSATGNDKRAKKTNWKKTQESAKA